MSAKSYPTCCKSPDCRRCFGTGDVDAWTTKPQPTETLCRLYHGVGCTRGCGERRDRIAPR